MSEHTKIEWTDNSWNPWQGCRKVSECCKNCYMFRDKNRYGQDPTTVVRSKPPTFNLPLKWHEPAKVFVCSWSDFFIVEADEWRDEAWQIMRRQKHLTFQILTKRPENIRDRLPDDWGDGWANVWLGVSVENQRAADLRIPPLLQIPAKVRFLSCEPLLGDVELQSVWIGDYYSCDGYYPKQLHWVICGGESGPNARPMLPDWAQSLRDQCIADEVPFFMKQIGGARKPFLVIPDDLLIREFP